MMSRSRPRTTARTGAPVILALLAAAAASGCTTAFPDVTGAVASSTSRIANPQQDAEELGARYRADPKNPDIAIRYAQALRNGEQRTQAVAVLEQASLQHPHHTALLGAYGRALADVGQFNQALEVLGRAHTPDQPDWRVLSAQGAVLDQTGRHEEAQRYYASALKIAPNEPSVMSNLGLSYALAKNLPRAEEHLRRASKQKTADPRVRQNLALVVGLQGRFDDAEAIARADLPPDEAAANVAYLRAMLAQKKDLKKIGRSMTLSSTGGS